MGISKIMSYYESLGVSKDATPEQIKSAFKKLAMKHHPDRGGDVGQFQKISEAYETLGDAEKRAAYDHGANNPFQNTGNPFQQGGFHFHTGNPFGGGTGTPFDDIFSQFGFGFANAGQPRNRDLNIRYNISLKDAYQGKRVNLNFQLPSGQTESLEVDIPPGIDHGQNIKLSGYGDNSIRNAPRGDLIIIVEIERHPKFRKEDINLFTETSVDIFEAMLGTTKTIENIDGTSVEVNIRAGTQHGQRYSCRGLGFKNIKHPSIKGDLIVTVNIKTPVIKDPKLIAMVNDLANKIRASS